MTKDGLLDQFTRNIKKEYDSVLDEALPQDMRDLLNRLSDGGSSERR